MNLLERILKIVICLIQIFCCVVLMAFSDKGFPIIFLYFILSFCIKGIGMIIYYIRMARFMVGGKKILYRGILFLDIGIVLMSASALPDLFLSFYLAVMLLYNGAMLIPSILVQKKSQIAAWKLNALHAGIIILGAILCVVCFRNQNLVVYIFAIDAIYGACVNIHDATKKTSVVFIQ